MIRRIWIDGYKSFKDFTLELRPLSLIFGPNASGKSNLLDALYLLSRAVTYKNLTEAFRGHRGLPLESFYYADEGYEKLREKDSVRMSFQVDVELSDATLARVRKIVSEKRRGIEGVRLDRELLTERFLRYRLELEALPATGHLRVRDERLSAITKVDGREKSSRAPFISREGERIRLRMERQAHPMDYDIGIDYTLISSALYEPHYPHITAFREELANWQMYYLEPQMLMREEVPLAEVKSLGPRGENLAAFLNVLSHRNSPDFENLNLALRSVMPTDARIDVELSKEGKVGFHLSEDGLRYSARLISEGTLRLIGLLAACHPANPATLIGYEEPENGVHPVRLKIVSDILKNVAYQYGKQVIVTTHSPIFAKYFNNDELFVCRKEGHQTAIRPFSSYGLLWRGDEILESLDDRILRGDFGG